MIASLGRAGTGAVLTVSVCTHVLSIRLLPTFLLVPEEACDLGLCHSLNICIVFFNVQVFAFLKLLSTMLRIQTFLISIPQ